MRRPKKERPLGRAEQAVMDQVWSRGPVSAEECRSALVATWPMKDSTIRTVLRRLEAKGYVSHEVVGRTFRYRAVEAPVAVATRAVRQLIDRFCGGSAETLMLGLVKDEVIGARDLERIQERIATAKKGSPVMSGFDSVAGSVVAAFIDAAGRSAVLAVLAAAGIALFRVRGGVVRLAVWRWVLCVSLVMPVLGAVLPAINIPVPAGDWRSPSASLSPSPRALMQTTEPRGDLAVASTATLPATFVPWIRAAGLVYFAGLLVFAVRTMRSWAAARDLGRRAATIDDESLTARSAAYAAALALKARPRLAESSDIAVPVTAGVRGPVILLPPSWRTWDEDTLDAVLLHELSHIRRADAVTQRIALAYRIVYWPNPLAWWIERHLAALAEVASDEAVLASRVAPVRYAEILLAFLAVAGRPSAARQWHVAMARVTGVERRIHRVLTWKERRPMSYPTLRYAMAAAAVAVLAATLSAARVEMLAAPAPVTVPASPLTGQSPRALPAKAILIALPETDRTPVATVAPVIEAQNPKPQQPSPAPVDDFAKGAYSQDTPGLTLPILTQSAHPKYTAEAMRAKLQGEIRLDVVIGHEGYVTRARVAGVSGNLEFLGLDTQVEPARRNLGLDEQALASVRQWRFQPGTLAGVAVPVLTSVNVSFRLF